METPATKITVKATINAPVEIVWSYWTEPEHIMQWNNASDDWHTTAAENDLRTGGKFMSRMEAKDGSFGFDFSGVYDEVVEYKKIVYSLDDKRQTEVVFESNDEDDEQTTVTETFDAENQHPVDFQRAGWQAILDNFKKYTETH